MFLIGWNLNKIYIGKQGQLLLYSCNRWITYVFVTDCACYHCWICKLDSQGEVYFMQWERCTLYIYSAVYLIQLARCIWHNIFCSNLLVTWIDLTLAETFTVVMTGKTWSQEFNIFIVILRKNDILTSHDLDFHWLCFLFLLSNFRCASWKTCSWLLWFVVNYHHGPVYYT